MRFAPLFAFVATSFATLASSSAQCPEWSTDFHAAGADGSVSGGAVVTEGGADVLYLVGDFSHVGAVAARRVARLDGTSVSGFGAGPSFVPTEVAIYDDGSGAAVYVAGGGSFPNTPGLARFDGTDWIDIPVNGPIHDLEVFDDGSGPALFVGGDFSSVGGVGAMSLARYDGAWTQVSSGVEHFTGRGAVFALGSFDDGTGERLVVGGEITEAGAVPAMGIAFWDGSSFSALGAGVAMDPSVFRAVLAVERYTDPSSGIEHLYVGGDFTSFGGMSGRWGRWSPASGWEPLPGGVLVTRDFAVTEAPGGDLLYAVGGHLQAGESRTTVVWNGASRVFLPPTADYDARMGIAYDSGAGDELWIGSDFAGINRQFHGVSLNQLMRWDGSSWQGALSGLGVGGGRFDNVNSLALHDFGAGPELVIGGKFAAVGGVESPLVARFDGTAWRALGAPFESWGVFDLISHDDGNGTALFACGDDVGLVGEGIVPALKFDGTSWVEVGQSISNFDEALVFAEFDEGSGPRLFMGGTFRNLDGTTMRFLGRWDGNAWSPVGGGLTGGGIFGGVGAMEVFDDGSGEALYVAGTFGGAGGVPVNNIARWDGSTWSAVGAGLESTISVAAPIVGKLEVFNSPGGAQLIAGGFIDFAGGAPVNALAAWDGTDWSPLGAGLADSSGFTQLQGLGAFDPDGQGERLYAAGFFDMAGGLPADEFAIWDGSEWTTPLTLTGFVNDFLTADVDGVRSLYAAGSFTEVAETTSTHLASFADPCAETVGLPFCSSLESSVGRHGIVRAGGSSSVAAQDLQLFARRLPAARPTLFFHGPSAVRVPFGEGLRCAGGAVRRIFPLRTSNALGEARLTLDFSLPYAANFAVGNTLNFQGWYRDQAGGPAGFNTTDGLQVTFRP